MRWRGGDEGRQSKGKGGGCEMEVRCSKGMRGHWSVHSQSILSLLAETQCPNMSVGVVEHLKEALVDHVLCPVN